MSGIQRTEMADTSLKFHTLYNKGWPRENTSVSASGSDAELYHSRCRHGCPRGVGDPRENKMNRSCEEIVTMSKSSSVEMHGERV